MITKGIRGAITIENNTADDIRNAVLQLLSQMFKANNINPDLISHIIFTLTNDLNAAFPAKFARVDMNLKDTAMMCYSELDVPHALKKCLRILIVYNCDKDFKPEFVYLKGAADLRK